MHGLIESLTPGSRHLHWRWVGGTFVLYVVLMIAAAGVHIRHESARNLRHEPATTVAIDKKHSSAGTGFSSEAAIGAL